MDEDNFIKLEAIDVVANRIVVYKFNYSGDSHRYLLSKSFYVKYDRPLENVSMDILSIPFVSGLASVAWVTGTNIYLDALDEEYLASLKEVMETLNRFYPKIGFRGGVIVDDAVSNRFRNGGIGQLFSGGLDSTTLYIQNMEYKPILFTVFGAVIPVSNRAVIGKVRESHSKFARWEGVTIDFIETNVREVINEPLLTAEYGKYLRNYDRTWWEGVNHGLILLSLCAPLTVDDVSVMRLASSIPTNPHGSHPYLTSKIRWGDVRVIPGGYEFERQDKVKLLLKPYITKYGYHPRLQLCNYAPVVSDQLNCGSCEKCSRNILSLLVEGIDPRRCGFPIIRGFYKHIKEEIAPEITYKSWKHIVEEIEEIKYYTLNSEEFISWLKDYEFARNEGNHLREKSFEWLLLHIYSHLPRTTQNKILNVLYQHKYIKKGEEIKYPALK
ncbi:MAG: hypothetical protein ACLFVP_06630 [Candidatus Bathyarchaeia archaeon]